MAGARRGGSKEDGKSRSKPATTNPHRQTVFEGESCERQAVSQTKRGNAGCLVLMPSPRNRALVVSVAAAAATARELRRLSQRDLGC